MTPPNINYQLEAIRKIGNALNAETIENFDYTIYEFRTSSLSLFCPVFLAFTVIHGAPLVLSFREDFYTNIGTTMHSVVQRWWPLYGKRKCNRCGKTTKGWGPIFCCGVPAEYIEYELKYKGLIGHCDGILDLLKDLFLLELKSSDAKKMKEMLMPLEEHIIQANTYTVMGNHCLKKVIPGKLKGHIIVYLDRANYRNYKAFVNLGVDIKHTNSIIRDYYLTKKLIQKKEFGELQKHRRCPSAKKARRYCKFRNICFSPVGIESMLNRMAKMRG